MPLKIVILLVCLLGLVPGCLKQGGADRKPPEVASERNRPDSGNAAASIVFVRVGIWIAGADGSSQRKIADGDDPEISPDGTRIACTLHGGNGQRFIAIVDVARGAPAVLTSIPGENNYGPRWSPDGSRLLFQHYTDGAWLPGIVEADNSGCRILNPGGEGRRTGGFHSPFWASNGAFIYCNDLQYLYELDLSGSVRAKTDVSVLLGRYRDTVSLSSASRFTALPGGNSIVFDADASETPGASALFHFDMVNRLVSRLSPTDFCGYDPSSTGGDLYFAGFMLTEDNRSRLARDLPIPTAIFRMRAGTRTPQLVIPDARQPSISAGHAPSR